ncbi:MAG TPA: hypothetical protein VFE54_04795, partial [Mucilaginibacter sp.]|nr:hypothetical protein [Mucilaginibacter sp.]
MKLLKIILIIPVFLLGPCFLFAQRNFIKNPIVGGYFADPTIIKNKGVYYIYATIDPWGADELGVLVTRDFKTFTQKHINWP